MPSGTLRPSSVTDSVLTRQKRPSTSRTSRMTASGIRKGKTRSPTSASAPTTSPVTYATGPSGSAERWKVPYP